MDKLWKWLMHADARALFFGSVALFAVVAGVVAWLRFGPAAVRAGATEPAPARPSRAPAETADAQGLGVLAFVSNQLAADTLTVPVNPFRPALDALFAGSQAPASAFEPPLAGDTNTAHRLLRNPWAGLRPTAGQQPAKPVIPTLTYRGYFQRPDGRYAALFHDSAAGASRFYGTGAVFRGVALLAAGTSNACVRLPDGDQRDMGIGDTVTLPEETP